MNSLKRTSGNKQKLLLYSLLFVSFSSFVLSLWFVSFFPLYLHADFKEELSGNVADSTSGYMYP